MNIFLNKWKNVTMKERWFLFIPLSLYGTLWICIKHITTLYEYAHNTESLPHLWPLRHTHPPVKLQWPQRGHRSQTCAKRCNQTVSRKDTDKWEGLIVTSYHDNHTIHAQAWNSFFYANFPKYCKSLQKPNESMRMSIWFQQSYDKNCFEKKKSITNNFSTTGCTDNHIFPISMALKKGHGYCMGIKSPSPFDIQQSWHPWYLISTR